MDLRNWLIAAAGTLALGYLAVPAQAAQPGGVASGIGNLRVENAAVQQVHRRKYRHRYYRHYRRYAYPYRRYHRYNYYGYTPGIYLHFGPRWNRHHHRRHWRW